MTTGENLTVAVSAAAAAIAQGLDEDQLEVLAGIFAQLGDSLALIAVMRSLEPEKKES